MAIQDRDRAGWRDKVTAFPPELVSRYRELGMWGERTIGEELEAVAAECPGRPAVIDPRRSLTYAELDRRSSAVAAGLLGLGLRVGERAIFQTDNRVEAVEAWYGCLKAGVIPVCALPAHGRHEIEALVETTGARAHLVDAESRGGAVLELAHGLRSRGRAPELLVSIGDDGGAGDARLGELAAGAPDSELLAAARRSLAPDDLAVLQLSGGTTSTPKGIPRLHAESWYNALATARRYPLLPGERVAHVIPLVHNAGVHSALHAGHSVGATVLTCGPDPDEFIPFLLRERAESIVLVPGIVSFLLEREDFRRLLEGLRRLSLSAAVVPPELFDRLEAMGVPVVQQFGMGEGLCTVSSLGEARELRRDTVGHPLSSEDEVRIVDPEGRNLPAGTPGELWVRGPYTIRGYWNDPERNAVAFTADGFYKTGDVIEAREVEGRRYLVVGGRIKDLINRGGEKINAEEVEDALRRHPQVREAALVAMPDPRLGERGCVYLVVRSPGAPPTLADLTALLAEIGMSKYKWPERVEYLDALPRTSVGKVEKARLREWVARAIEEEESEDADS
ncbi:MAG: AMP-binding protein [Actinobacteria bacterium]|nr:AMP-binding protein [Actinomycetota bacterium]